ncbi:hypothetical protein D1007_20216 [Hordeum vulgare]|nr:hypothetical protein D1007_20216 [Hordeum vulgare]
MNGHGNARDDAERRRHRVSDATRKRGSRGCLKYGLRPPPTFERHELEEYEHELATRCIGSSSSRAVGSSSAGASSSRAITQVKRRMEELGPLTVKIEDDVGELRGRVIGPEDYLPLGRRITSCTPSWSAR